MDTTILMEPIGLIICMGIEILVVLPLALWLIKPWKSSDRDIALFQAIDTEIVRLKKL